MQKVSNMPTPGCKTNVLEKVKQAKCRVVKLTGIIKLDKAPPNCT